MDRHAFARQQRFIHMGISPEYFAVDRYLLSTAYQYQITNLELRIFNRKDHLLMVLVKRNHVRHNFLRFHQRL